MTIEYVLGYLFLHKYDERFWSTYCNLENLNFIKYLDDKLKITAKLKDAFGMALSDGKNESDSDSDGCIYECTCAIKCEYTDGNITWNQIFQ